MYLRYIFPLSSTHLWLHCSNFFNPSKKNSFGCAATRKIGNKKSQRLISTPTFKYHFFSMFQLTLPPWRQRHQFPPKKNNVMSTRWHTIVIKPRTERLRDEKLGEGYEEEISSLSAQLYTILRPGHVIQTSIHGLRASTISLSFLPLKCYIPLYWGNASEIWSLFFSILLLPFPIFSLFTYVPLEL
jgi:hypothetical protein